MTEEKNKKVDKESVSADDVKSEKAGEAASAANIKDEKANKAEEAEGKKEVESSQSSEKAKEKAEGAGDNKTVDALKDKVQTLDSELKEKDKQLSQYIELAQRIKAEFDNYKKRTIREKEQLYTDISANVILKLLPVVDNLERAVSSDASDGKSILEGLKMILKQIKDVLCKEGVEEIQSVGKNFDPNLHNAVMHIEDKSYKANTIVEEFQKGYKLKDKVIRHSMVKVAN
ncbi:MAG: nucleotide exchange factor GrpE [Clostridiales bacterium]|mgnify:CR=1 FL=1|nr:nucleotide exchange factor GrpE [Clostridiales bacterium]HBM79771.1 nucleotide exchange factor GrpE [Clostridiaceae bacterium]